LAGGRLVGVFGRVEPFLLDGCDYDAILDQNRAAAGI
jgi:hypothetical protein